MPTPQDARFLHDFHIIFNNGASIVSANSQILRAAYPILRHDTYDSLTLPTATSDTIAVILQLAYTGRFENPVILTQFWNLNWHPIAYPCLGYF